MKHWKRRFFTIWTGQALSFLGSGLTQFALVWWLTITTGSATVLTFSTLIAVLPTIVLGPFAGALADRWNRRLILILADGVVALATLTLLMIYLFGELQVWQVYVAVLVRSIAGSFHFPTIQASISQLVPTEQLTRVSGLNQSLLGMGHIVSPPLGALLLDSFGMGAALSLDVLTALIAVVPLLFVAIPQPKLTESADVTGIADHLYHDMRDGLRYVRHWPGLLIALIMSMLINLVLSPAFALIPILVSKVLEGSAGMLAIVRMGFGIGVIMGGALLAVWGGLRNRIVTSLIGLAGVGIACALVGFSSASMMWLALAGMFVVGFMMAFTSGPLMAVLQAVVDPGMQARVLALIGSLSSLMAPVGLLVAGPLSDLVGVRLWYFISAFICVGMSITGFFIPALMTLEQQKTAHLTSGSETIDSLGSAS
jgi:DHA3 family macrolide efflux protein-like MFS transporter